jgi:hypothetical protein
MDSYTAALDLLRRLPPTNVTSNLDIISRLCPDIAEDLAVSVDSPLQLKNDGETGKEYLCCDYNRDGESYRYVIISLACNRASTFIESTRVSYPSLELTLSVPQITMDKHLYPGIERRSGSF